MINLTDMTASGADRFPVRQPMPRAQAEPRAREILALKQRLNAVILAYNYQVPEIQDVADLLSWFSGPQRHYSPIG